MESQASAEAGERTAGEEWARHAPFSLRAATEADRDFLWSLTAITMREYVAEVAGWDERLQEKQFLSAFDPVRWRVLTVDGRDVGGFAVHRHSQALYLSDLYLLPAYQGRGIGSVVIRMLISEAKEAGVPLLLQVLDSNPRARRLYERLGFSFLCPSPLPHYALMAAHR